MGNVFKTQGGFSASIDPVGKRSTAEQQWQAVNYTTQVLGFAAIDDAVEATITVLGKTLILDEISADEDLGDQHYTATAKYIDPESPAATNEAAANNEAPELSFDVTGATQHVNRSISVRAKAGTDDAQLFGGAIGLERERGGGWKINGVDVEMPQMSMNVSFKIPQPVDPFAFARALNDAVGCTNVAAWFGFGPTDLLFKSARVGGKLRDKWVMNYVIACSKTVTINLGNYLGNIEKRGWDYLDVIYEPVPGTEGDPRIFPQARYAFSHQLYPEINFTVLGMGG